MDDLLFLAHRIPYPPDKGDKIRSWRFLSHLAERYRVHLGCFVDDPRDWRHVDRLKELCGDTYFAPLGARAAKLRGLAGLATGAPVTLVYFRAPKLAAWVAEVMAKRRPRIVFIFSSSMAQYAMDGCAPGTRRIVDLVDIDSEKWRAYSAMRPRPARWLYRREGRRLLDFERRVAAAFDASLLVSAGEADAFRRLAPEQADKVFAVENGVDISRFTPDFECEDPFPPGTRSLAFTGAMDYWPNVDAVSWFARQVFPRLRARVPAARFVIVGANPAPAVRRLGRLPGIAVTGRVADVRPYLAHAAAVVAPLRAGRGVQNKVLEAMAMGKAVVATPTALDGIGAEPGGEVLAADGVEAFADAAASALSPSLAASIGRRARARVIARHAWGPNLERLDSILEGGEPMPEDGGRPPVLPRARRGGQRAATRPRRGHPRAAT